MSVHTAAWSLASAVTRELYKPISFVTSEAVGEISTADLLQKVGIRKETLLDHLDTLLAKDRLQVITGVKGTKFYRVK
jgi:hypothetical protein